MNYSYELTDLVIKDIDDTLSYISNKLCNKKAAIDLMNNIEACINNICTFPLSYPNCNYYLIKDDSIRHPIVIRIDRDVANAECNHPENHLTINNIKNSRFRVENIINIFDFVVFVLDILYGVKAQDSKQFISLNYIV